MVENINKTMFWLFVMLFAGVIVWALVMSAHRAHAKAYDNPEISRLAQDELKIKPRGPGGPPVVIIEQGWGIEVFTFEPGGKAFGVTLGTAPGQPRRFDTEKECQDYFKGKEWHNNVAQLNAFMRKSGAPPSLQTAAICFKFPGDGERVD